MKIGNDLPCIIIHALPRRSADLGREVSVHRDVISPVLIVKRRVHAHIPVARAIRHGKDIETRTVGRHVAGQPATQTAEQVYLQVSPRHLAPFVVCLQLSVYEQSLLNRKAFLPLRVSQYLPHVIFAPALHKHQQICCPAVLLVIGLEIIFRIVNIPP